MHDCYECYGTGYVWFNPHRLDIDLDMALCPVCDGAGVLVDDDDEDIEEQEGDGNAERVRTLRNHDAG